MDPLDESLKAAMRGLEQQASDRYFDELPGQVMARLEESMQSDVNRPGTSAAGQSAVGSNGKGTERQEDSGLHDIRALAETTKQRMSQRKIPTVHPPVDHDVLNASSASLRAVALPEPARMVSLEIPASLAAGTRPAAAIRDHGPATAAASASAITPLPARSKAPMIIAGTVAFAAAAGAVGYFGFMKDKGKAEPSEAPTQVAAAPATTVTPIETAPSAAAAADTAPAPAAVSGTAPAATGGTGTEAAASGAALIGSAGDSKTDDSPAKAAADDDDKARRDKRDADKDADKAKDKADGAKGKDAAAITTAAKKDDATAKAKDDGKKPGADGKAAAEATKPAPGPADKQEQSLDDLLKGAGVDTSAPKEEKPKLEKKGLDAGDIRKTMSALNGRAQGCYAKFGVTGSVAVKLTVDPSGSVKKTVVTGAAAGTPSGDCVADIAGTASFPPWDGAPMTVNYSYFLSE